MKIEDDDLISFATTCSSKEIRLAAEIELRKRYPSRKAKKIFTEYGHGFMRDENEFTSPVCSSANCPACNYGDCSCDCHRNGSPMRASTWPEPQEKDG